MKSSTIRRSNLSKEKMAVLESLSKYKYDHYDNSPNVYIRPEKANTKEKELEVLWQNFKVNQKSEKSPNIYLATGFIAGAVVMLLITVLVSFTAKGINSVKENVVVPVKKENAGLNFVPASTEQKVSASETYTVQSGDTIEGILIRFYGSYSKEKEEAILKANNLTNPDKLSIGQQLTIPMY